MTNPVQDKEVGVPVVHPSSLAWDLASAHEAASVGIRGAVSAGSFVAASVGAPDVASADTPDAAYVGPVHGAYLERHPYTRGL